jgi:hypothetical protein
MPVALYWSVIHEVGILFANFQAQCEHEKKSFQTLLTKREPGKIDKTYAVTINVLKANYVQH